MSEHVEEKRTTTDVVRSFCYSSALFLGFIAFANLLHSLSCGYWCEMFFGHA